jgi:hypothetical protein
MTESQPRPVRCERTLTLTITFVGLHTVALIPRVGCGRGLLYAWVSLSHASLLVVGIRACEVMGETRFAGSVFTRRVLARRCAGKATGAGGLRRAASTSCRPRQLFSLPHCPERFQGAAGKIARDQLHAGCGHSSNDHCRQTVQLR